ncbi:hypothetical protein PBY51_014061 [Eleginops maclovinus]|uniref:Chemokine interleukin-8-like domain-containing protein n=1 Tax=Eleginops maclovinus TaxID=56733 RepID=A0AAN7WYB5_ELEMC|nr:hypothetical protein PBY51_014061 [Eleginops maclovinus]
MWTCLSVSRWIFLLTLTVVMLFLASEGVDGEIHIKCCKPTRQRKIAIKHCYNQTKRYYCNRPAYKVADKSGKWYCVPPNSSWLKELRDAGLKCPPDISPILRKMFKSL